MIATAQELGPEAAAAALGLRSPHSLTPNPQRPIQIQSSNRGASSEESDKGRRRNGRAPRRHHRPLPVGGRWRGRRAGRRRRRHYTPQPQVPRHRFPRHLCCLLGRHDRQLQLRIQPGKPAQVRFASSLFLPLRISSRSLFYLLHSAFLCWVRPPDVVRCLVFFKCVRTNFGGIKRKFRPRQEKIYFFLAKMTARKTSYYFFVTPWEHNKRASVNCCS